MADRNCILENTHRRLYCVSKQSTPLQKDCLPLRLFLGKLSKVFTPSPHERHGHPLSKSFQIGIHGVLCARLWIVSNIMQSCERFAAQSQQQCEQEKLQNGASQLPYRNPRCQTVTGVNISYTILLWMYSYIFSVNVVFICKILWLDLYLYPG